MRILKYDKMKKVLLLILFTLCFCGYAFCQTETKIVNIINGNWSGTIIQEGAAPYVLNLSCSFEKNEFKFYIPTLDCSGIMKIETIADISIDFREYTLAGKGNCANGGLVRLSFIDNDHLELLFYLPNSKIINGKGILMRQ
jgi:hypothetical protein